MLTETGRLETGMCVRAVCRQGAGGLQMGARGALEKCLWGHFLARAGAHTALPTLFCTDSCHRTLRWKDDN